MVAAGHAVFALPWRLAAQPSHAPRQGIAFPWFALGFITVALFNSLHLPPAAGIAALNQLANLLLAMAMATLSLTTRFSALRKAGAKPLLLGLMVFVRLMVGGGAINLLVQHFAR